MNLIEAVINNDVRAVIRLLEKGEDPNLYQDIARLRPLHFAAQYNSLNAAAILLQHGANPRAKSQDGYSPLDIARLHQHTEMITLLEYWLKENGLK